MRRLTVSSLIVLVTLAGACTKSSSDAASGTASPGADSAAQAITANGLLEHIKDLSADSMEGRGPGTPGEDKAVAYMQSQFKAIGLEPGNPDGTYLQNVALIGYKSHPTASFTVEGKDHRAQVPRRLHRQLAPRPSGDEHRQRPASSSSATASSRPSTAGTTTRAST